MCRLDCTHNRKIKGDFEGQWVGFAKNQGYLSDSADLCVKRCRNPRARLPKLPKIKAACKGRKGLRSKLGDWATILTNCKEGSWTQELQLHSKADCKTAHKRMAA